MKRFLLIFGLLLIGVFGVLSQPISFVSAESAESEEFVKIIVNSTKLYKTTNLPAGEHESLTVDFAEEYKLLQEDVQGINEIKFVKVEKEGFGDGYGFLISTHIIKKSQDSLKYKLDTNAKINKDNAKFFIRDEDKYIEVDGTTLNTETKVKLVDGYDKSKTYLKAMVEIGDRIEVGYLHINDIEVSKISVETILAIVIFAFCSISGGITIYKVTKKKNRDIGE